MARPPKLGWALSHSTAERPGLFHLRSDPRSQALLRRMNFPP